LGFESSFLFNFQFRQVVDDLHRFEADGDHAEEEFERIGGVVHRLGGPEVCVVDDAGVFVGRHRLAFDHPFNRALAVNDVIVSLVYLRLVLCFPVRRISSTNPERS
jgi:hypothetical protein